MHDDEELRQLRAAMDICNRRLAAVLHERARLVRRIGAHKRDRAHPALDPQREAAMFAALADHVPADGFPADDLHSIFAAVLAASRRLVVHDITT